MLDLRAEATTAWLMENGSEDIARLLRQKCVGEPPELSQAFDAFGHALDSSITGGTDLLDRALRDGLAAELAQVMAHIDGGRRLRILQWLTSAGFEQPHEIISLLSTPTTPGSHAMLRWIVALLRREQLDRMFSFERIQTLQAACHRTGQTEQSR